MLQSYNSGEVSTIWLSQKKPKVTTCGVGRRYNSPLSCKKVKSSTGGVGRGTILHWAAKKWKVTTGRVGRYNSQLDCKKWKVTTSRVARYNSQLQKKVKSYNCGSRYNSQLDCTKWKVTKVTSSRGTILHYKKVKSYNWKVSVQFACLSAPPAHCPPPANGTAPHATRQHDQKNIARIANAVTITLYSKITM